MLKRTCILILLVLLAGASPAEDAPVLTRIDANRDRGFDYLDLYTTSDVKADGLLLENKLIIDLPGVKVAKDIKVEKRKSERIKDIRVKQLKDKAQIVVDLKKNIDYEIVNVFGRGKSVVEICDRIDYAERLMAAWEKENIERKAPKLQPQEYQASPTKEALPLRGKTIVIDPGHGGVDLGSVSQSGIPEKHITLQTAKKLARALNAAGAKVYLTRDNDRTVGIRVRADIFISLHYNFSPIKKASGTETFYYNRNSRGLALTLHRAMLQGIRRRDRGLRREKYYTIHHTRMPAVLIEPVYISNAEEEKLALSAAFQQKLANDIVRGVKDYFRSKNG
jgi:N-acetylmuramoyl-L-alanine amidase